VRQIEDAVGFAAVSVATGNYQLIPAGCDFQDFFVLQPCSDPGNLQGVNEFSVALQKRTKLLAMPLFADFGEIPKWMVENDQNIGSACSSTSSSRRRLVENSSCRPAIRPRRSWRAPLANCGCRGGTWQPRKAASIQWRSGCRASPEPRKATGGIHIVMVVGRRKTPDTTRSRSAALEFNLHAPAREESSTHDEGLASHQ